MAPLSTLRGRIFAATCLLALLPIGVALQFLSARAARESEAQLQRGLTEAAALVEQHHAAARETLLERARLVADLPKLKAAIDTRDPSTIEPLARDYRDRVKADVFALTDGRGRLLAALGDAAGDLASGPPVQRALGGEDAVTLQAGAAGIFDAATVLVSMEQTHEVLGTLTLGSSLDDALAARFKALTGSDVAFAYEGRVRASTLPKDAVLEPALRNAGVSSLHVAGDDYVAIHRPLGNGPDAPQVVILRSRGESLRFLRTLRAALLLAAGAGVAVAVLLSYLAARTVTQPLAAITDSMREMSRTGDLARRIELVPGQDEDTRLLASTFNTMVDSIARFQREAALRARLSALGRLSTVIAHEVRNPLMIIKGSLRALRRDGTTPPEAGEALADIDHEVARLDRIVGDVLDFARPVRVECAPADLNAICREAVQAAVGADGGPEVELRLAALPPVVTDAERLRTVLVNVLSNARDSVEARPEPRDALRPAISVRTLEDEGGKAAVVVEDRGLGIAAEDLPHVFEPYFTTKRTGTGLGLAIAKNIVESLGGTVTAQSRVGEGTAVRLELPFQGPPGTGVH